MIIAETEGGRFELLSNGRVMRVLGLSIAIVDAINEAVALETAAATEADPTRRSRLLFAAARLRWASEIPCLMC